MLAALASGLAEQGATALLVIGGAGKDPDLLPFLGEGRVTGGLVIVPRGKAPRLLYLTPMEREEAEKARVAGCEPLTPQQVDLPRWSRQGKTEAERLEGILGQALLHSGVTPGKVLLAGHGAAGVIHDAVKALTRDGWSFASGHAVLARARRCKGEGEVREIRQVAAATVEAFERVASLLRSTVTSADGTLLLEGEPLTVGRLKGEVAVLFARAGLEQPEGNIVAPAEEGAVPHNQGNPERVLRSAEALVVDLFPRGRLFADCTRTFCVGEAPAPLQRAHSTVLEALLQAHRLTRPRVRGWDLQRVTCELFEERGFATLRSDPESAAGYVHGLGHGVGYELHEAPSFRENAAGEEGEILEGDVLTLEPGLYDPEAGYGVRLEDLVRVTTEGIENWTPLPYDLDPAAWGRGR